MAIVLLYGGLLAIDGQVSIGTLFAFNAYVIMLQAPFRMFGFLLLQTQRASASASESSKYWMKSLRLLTCPQQLR